MIKRFEAKAIDLSLLSALFVFVQQNLFNLAVQNLAKVINKLGRNTLIMSQSVDSATADIVFVYESVCRNTFFFHCFPKRGIYYHYYHHYYYKL